MGDSVYFFWNGFCSNWATSRFEYKGHSFKNSEQAFMWEKALYFKDDSIAEKVLKETDPRKSKALGRKVKDFDVEKWSEVSYKIMYGVVLEKFKQNENLKKQLLDIKETLIVEASPYDKVWGIGLSEEVAQDLLPSQWKGTNWLGKVLMKVRNDLT